MDKQEAIERLKQNKAAAEFYAGMTQIGQRVENELKDIEAFEMAIEALSAEPTDLISRADAIEELGEYFDHLKRIDKRGIKRIEPISLDCKGIINKLPSADRPTGKWIMHIDDLYPEESTQECSNCHEHETIKISNDNYCPNCGAKMGSDVK